MKRRLELPGAIYGEHVVTSNSVRTSKYTWYNFLPVNLMEQFQNLTNVYFLVMALMQTVPDISVTRGKPTMLMPLSIVISICTVKDLWEDNKRKQDDRRENERCVRRLNVQDPEAQPQRIQWEQVRLGDFLRIERNCQIPADVLLLDSTDEFRCCHVETMSLDGETNLKRKECALPETWKWSDLESGFVLDFESPSAELYEFKAALIKNEKQPTEEILGINISNILLRGSILRQTESVIGLVVYCGHETRVMCNAKKSAFKRSQLDHDMNSFILSIFAVEVTLCLLAGIFSLLWERWSGPFHWYLRLRTCKNPLYCLMLKSGTWVIQMSNMVPISMVVALTTVKFCQGKMVSKDKNLTDQSRNQPAGVHCSQVLESLGQITHVFSDKTGTLTNNEMMYKACSVANKVYGMQSGGTSSESPLSPFQSPVSTAGSRGSSFSRSSPSSTSFVRPVYSEGAGVDFSEKQGLLEDCKQYADNAFLCTIMTDFLLCHAVCHTVTIGYGELGPKYAASSPDELALVTAASDFGLIFEKSEQKMRLLSVKDSRLRQLLQKGCGLTLEKLSLEVLEICEFDNDRKRMSVVVRYPNGELVLLMKGADDSILPHARNDASSITLQEHFARFATDGLRTLCLASRHLMPEELEIWHDRYNRALADVSDNRASRIADMSKELEERPGLQLLGATAVEDRLQYRVAETIEHLRMAGICVWVLTGDKVETAINISKACRLLTDSMYLIVMSDENEVLQDLRDFRPRKDQAMTITGAALSRVLSTEEWAQEFYSKAVLCQTVLCCRVSPKQKAQVVEVAHKQHLRFTQEVPVTLSIGDGDNDVAMITTAHVGVGLAGKEGSQAARAGDFAIGEFHLLEQLVFTHGHECYRRNAILVCYNFYKNVLLVLPPMLWGPWMNFSGQPFYEQFLYQLYNVCYTLLPCVLFALFDESPFDLNEPQNYFPGRHKMWLNAKVFTVWMMLGASQAVLLTYNCFMSLGDGTVYAELTSGDLWSTGTVLFGWVIISATATMMLRMHAPPYFVIAAAILSILCHPATMWTFENLGNNTLRGQLAYIYGKGLGRVAIATCFAISVHTLLGEHVLAWVKPPQLQSVDRLRLPGANRNQQRKQPSEIELASIRETGEAESDEFVSFNSITCSVEADKNEAGVRMSKKNRPVPLHTNHAFAKECERSRTALVTEGRRASLTGIQQTTQSVIRMNIASSDDTPSHQLSSLFNRIGSLTQ